MASKPSARPDRARRTTRSRARRLHLESLETRTLLAVDSLAEVRGATVVAPFAEVRTLAAEETVEATANERFVAYVAGALVDQPLHESVRERLVRFLDRGVSRERIAGFVLRSLAARRAEITNTYEKLLHREPTTRELASHLAARGRQADQIAVIASVLSSAEYYHDRAQGTVDGFVQSLALDLFGRAPTESEAARWRDQLSRGVPRARLVANVLSGSTYRDAALGQLARRVSSQAGNPAILDLLAPAWRSPQPLTGAKARLFGSDAFLARLLDPPPIPVTPPTDSPSAGVPLTPKFSIATGWTSIPNPIDQLSTFGASPDGTYWFGTEGSGMIVTDLIQNTTNVSWSGAPYSIAPISSTVAWLVASDAWQQTPFYVGTLNVDGTFTKVAGLPNGDTPAQIAAAPDGTVWVLAQSGVVYAYAASSDSWSVIPNDGFSIEQISIGSGASIWAIARSQGTSEVLSWSATTGWSVDSFFQGANPSLVSATADGSVFVVATALNQTVFLRHPEGDWIEVPNQTPPGMIYLIAGADRNRMLAATLGNDLEPLSLLSIGVVDRPRELFPFLTSQWELGYEAINAGLGITVPGGVRALYTDQLADLGTWYTKLTTNQIAIPLGISAENWGIITNQIATEVNNVQGVNRLFNLLNKVNGATNQVNSQTLGNAVNRVGLTTHEQSTNPITLAIEAMFEAAVAGIATLFTGTAATIAAILASGFDSAVSDLTGQNNPGPDTKLTETSIKLQSDLTNLFVTTGSTYASQWTTVASDYGMLSAVGEAVNSGLWFVPDGEAQTLAAAAKPAFEIFFYQALMPTKWQIVYLHDYLCDLNVCPDVRTPNYATYEVVLNQAPNSVLEDIYFVHEIGASTDPYDDPGPFPTKGLMDHLWSIGVAKSDFYMSTNGWTLQQVNATG